jgi:hypothetical protein
MIDEQKDDRHSVQPLLPQTYVSSRRRYFEAVLIVQRVLEAPASRKVLQRLAMCLGLCAAGNVCRLMFGKRKKTPALKDKPELNVNWQPVQGVAIVYNVEKDEITVEQRPSLS